MNCFYWRISQSSAHKLARLYSKHSVSGSQVRVRFAPSPTGHLHLGGYRTAIYNYLFSKSCGGQFILRIEDTDQARLVPGSAEKLEKILHWSGIIPDESPLLGGEYGPYFQSERLSFYSKYASELLDKGFAYRCFCTETRLELLKKEANRTKQPNKYDRKCLQLSASEINDKISKNIPYTIRFMLTPELQTFEDLIYGQFSHDVYSNEGDPIIVKSDGFPTYHFANVVDDHLMNITHVLRGVEWQVSTPKHIMLYKALGWDPPIFGHLPLIMNKDGTKLSKRQGDLHLQTLKDRSYYPESVLNFVTSVGGGFHNRNYSLDKLYSLDDLNSIFDIEKVHTSSCKIELEKLDIINRFAIMENLKTDHSKKALIEECRKIVLQKIRHLNLVEDDVSDETIEKYLIWGQNRISKLQDIVNDDLLFLWAFSVNDDVHISLNEHLLDSLIQLFEENGSDQNSLFASIKKLCKEKGVKFPSVMKDLRVLITGHSEGAPVTDLVELLGVDSVVKRMKQYKCKRN